MAAMQTDEGISNQELLDAVVLRKKLAVTEYGNDEDVVGRHILLELAWRLLQRRPRVQNVWVEAARFLRENSREIDDAVWGRDYDLE